MFKSIQPSCPPLVARASNAKIDHRVGATKCKASLLLFLLLLLFFIIIIIIIIMIMIVTTVVFTVSFVQGTGGKARTKARVERSGR